MKQMNSGKDLIRTGDDFMILYFDFVKINFNACSLPVSMATPESDHSSAP
jgi:hypothetical protein